MITYPTISGNEFVVQISTKLQYLKSYNYDLFSFYTTNRTPSHWTRILESIEIQDLTDRQPILAYKDPDSGKLFISDGQNRFLACKNSKRPIYAIVVLGDSLKKGEETLSILNSYQKNWTTDDYLQFYASKGYDSYKKMMQAKSETGFTITSLITLSGDKSAKGHKRFKAGEFKVKSNLLLNARIVKMCYDAVIRNKLSIYGDMGQRYIVSTIYSILRSGAKSRILIDQLNKYGHLIEPCGNNTQYFAMWSKIYNYKKHASTRVSLVAPTQNSKTSWDVK